MVPSVSPVTRQAAAVSTQASQTPNADATAMPQSIPLRTHSMQASQNHTPAPGTGSIPDPDINMATAFVDWFYKMLNSYNPHWQSGGTEAFGTHHFYPTCSMKILIPTSCEMQEHHGADAVVDKFLGLVKSELLLFNPNMERSGIRAMSDPHGLKWIHVCGTVHRNSEALGIFQQSFGLIRDPTTENNWKIKFSNLKLVAEQSCGMPTLEQTGVLVPV